MLVRRIHIPALIEVIATSKITMVAVMVLDGVAVVAFRYCFSNLLRPLNWIRLGRLELDPLSRTVVVC